MDVKACKNYFQKGKKEKSIKFGVKKQEKEPKEQTLLDLDRVVQALDSSSMGFWDWERCEREDFASLKNSHNEKKTKLSTFSWTIF